jgi:hypothetical protein
MYPILYKSALTRILAAILFAVPRHFLHGATLFAAVGALRIMSNSEAPRRPLTFMVSAPTPFDEDDPFYDPYFVPPEPPKLRAKPQTRWIGPGKLYADDAAFEADLKAWEAEHADRKECMADRERHLKRLRDAHRDRTHERRVAQRRASAPPQPQPSQPPTSHPLPSQPQTSQPPSSQPPSSQPPPSQPPARQSPSSQSSSQPPQPSSQQPFSQLPPSQPQPSQLALQPPPLQPPPSQQHAAVQCCLLPEWQLLPTLPQPPTPRSQPSSQLQPPHSQLPLSQLPPPPSQPGRMNAPFGELSADGFFGVAHLRSAGMLFKPAKQISIYDGFSYAAPRLGPAFGQ